MNIKKLHPNFIMPTKSTEFAGAYDIYMVEDGMLIHGQYQADFFNLGFSAEVPPGHVALMLPRSGVGTKSGLELNNTCGVIDSDYRGEWKVALRLKDKKSLRFYAGERLLQFLIVPVASLTLKLVDDLSDTVRGEGGFGSTGV